MFANFITLSLLATSAVSHNFLISNDDGWATAQARAQYDSLVAAGFDVILSAPAVVHSSEGSTTQKPVPLKTTCQFNTCPVGSPAEGSDPNDPRLNYVNGFGVDAVKYGIQTLAPKFLGGPPDLVISGPNIGDASNTKVQSRALGGASNFQVAVEAVKEGVPAAAFFTSSPGTTEVSYTTLTTNANSTGTRAALLYADLTTLFTGTWWASGAPFFSPGRVLLVNYPPIAGCPTVSDYKFVLAKVATTKITTVKTCGRAELPLASNVITTKGCFASVVVLNANTQEDVTNIAYQQEVLDRFGSLISCLP